MQECTSHQPSRVTVHSPQIGALGALTDCSTVAMPRPALLDRLDGSPFALPRGLDRLSERWWSLSPRQRSVGILALLALIVTGGISHVAATPYGPPAAVLVAAQDLRIGHELGPGDVRRTNWPEGLIPDGALTDASGRLATPLPAGSVLTDRHLASGGIAALLPVGTVAVPLPVEAIPAIEPGQLIDLIGRDVQGTGGVLAHDAQVLSADALDVWVAVSREQAPDVAAAAATGTITVVVVGP